jgi:hypothetical protein
MRISTTCPHDRKEVNMDWAERRIEEYQRGEHATPLEQIMIGYFNRQAYAIFLTGAVLFLYGLWTRSWRWIISGGFGALFAPPAFSWYSGWTDTRFRAYTSGDRQPGWLEKRVLEEAHPPSFWIRLTGGALFVRGMWSRQWRWIALGAGIGLITRLIPWIETRLRK